ncbi:hypothetical protein Abr02nite_81570 [Paractinoplanes brasiliensis]|nr:hypothetical protein Abr02nite_81570 [Actinoplanes brasiliensis]
MFVLGRPGSRLDGTGEMHWKRWQVTRGAGRKGMWAQRKDAPKEARANRGPHSRSAGEPRGTLERRGRGAGPPPGAARLGRWCRGRELLEWIQSRYPPEKLACV